MPFFFTAGCAARGLLDVRPQDAIGLGIAYGHFSDDLGEIKVRMVEVRLACFNSGKVEQIVDQG